MKIFITTIFAVLLTGVSIAQEVSISDVYPDEIKIQGFEVANDGEVEISGAGAVLSDDWQMLIYYGWIIDSDTREVVWHLFDFMKEERMRGVSGVFDFKTKVNLKKGGYELYYAAVHSNNNWDAKYNDNNWTVTGFNEVMDMIFGFGDRRSYRRSIQEDLYINIDGANTSLASASQLQSKFTNDAEVSLVKVGKSSRLSKGFSLKSSTDLRVYAIGEGTRGEMFDYAWIIDANTRERVFEMTSRNVRHAGGAKKNVMIDEVITLPKGDYMLNYSSDDSHSFDKWNSVPPHDISFYGVTLTAASAKGKGHFTNFVAPKTMEPLVSLTQARDDELLAKGMSVKKEIQVRLFCLGEEGYGDDMADHGWIVDARTREKVWRMKSYQTKHAGGANKNRSVEEVITLEPGDYIVYYATDDSHAYRDWNSSQPFEPEMWGITMWATNESDLSSVSFFHPEKYKNENEIAVIAMVGDRELVKKNFTIQKNTKVRVLAMGEGTSGEMHDYGFIKNLDTGKIVWEMDYRNSDHGGGARKNREFNESVLLEKGTYRVYFETDGSHSYNRWNADPPTNDMWGISVLLD